MFHLCSISWRFLKLGSRDRFLERAVCFSERWFIAFYRFPKASVTPNMKSMDHAFCDLPSPQCLTMCSQPTLARRGCFDSEKTSLLERTVPWVSFHVSNRAVKLIVQRSKFVKGTEKPRKQARVNFSDSFQYWGKVRTGIPRTASYQFLQLKWVKDLGLKACASQGGSWGGAKYSIQQFGSNIEQVKRGRVCLW